MWNLQTCQLFINFSTATHDAVSGEGLYNMFIDTMPVLLSSCIVVLEESLLLGYDTASLDSWFMTALSQNIFEPVTQWHGF
jgi:hypothetical protein